MRIASVEVRNFRSLRAVSIEVEDYAVFIGANGAGKSSLLYALDWFFNETALSRADLHGYREGESLPEDSTIEVEVTFVDLTATDRERLDMYGRGDRAVIRRTWYAADGRTKTVGNARQGPGFAEARGNIGVPDRRKLYRDLRAKFVDLPDLGGSAPKDAILDALTAWEADPANFGELVAVADADASQMKGWNGMNVVRSCVQYVLIPAATSIASEVGTTSRGAALTQLVGALMSSGSALAQAAWLEKHADAVAELSRDVRASIESATSIQASRINARLASLVPNATVVLTPTVPELAPRVDPSIATAVVIDGITNDVSLQGHGVQRAVMISMLQAIVPDADLTRTTHTAQEGEDEAATQARLAEALSGLPSIIVAIEEPEIYQHPIRARAFAGALIDMSQTPGVQVILATHSPYFVQPEQFSALRRFSCPDGATEVASASIESVASKSGVAKDQVAKAIMAYVPTEFSEGFFADGVALVEGPTDRVVLEAAAARLGKDFDRHGITILSVEGKGGLRVARGILAALRIPTYVLADGDFGTSARKTNKDDPSRASAHENHRRATDGLVSALPATSEASHGALPYAFGDPTVVCRDFAIWRDDIEEELGSWASFDAALAVAGVVLASRSNKNLLAYRNAVMAAEVIDMPELLVSVIERIQELTNPTREPAVTTES